MAQKAQLTNSIKQNNLRQVTLLLEAGCDINATDTSGFTPLITSLVYITDPDSRLRVLKQLIKAGADINKTDKKGKSPLTYAFALNQGNSVEFLLQQTGVDPNLPDRDGVTPLMHAATLGHPEAVKVMMEHNRSGSVAIDIGARDSSGQTALDHANKHDSHNLQTNSQSVTNKHAEVKELLTSYSNDAGAIRCPSPTNSPDEGIELTDMRRTSNNIKNVHQNRSPGPHRPPGQTMDGKDKDKPYDDRDASIRRWASDLKQQHEDAGRMSSLRSPSVNNAQRPGSRQGTSKSIPLKERPSSSLSVHARSTRPGSSQNKNLSVDNKVEPYLSGDEDDEDISLESLSDLLGTVRQYAKEIHEIYAPIQRDEEERIRKRNERNARRKSKELNKHAVSPSGKHLVPPNQHEVRVEIHKLEDQMREKIQGKGKGRSKHEIVHSKSHEIPTSQPVASLHVENEQLSSTWPRGRHRSASRERFWSDTTSEKQKFNTMHSVPSSSSFTRPQIPPDWGDEKSIKQEREILNKAFQRIHKPGIDPLLGTSNKNPKKWQAQIDLMTSRQGVTQVAKQQQQTRQGGLPSISIIPPPMERGSQQWGVSSGALPSASSTENIPSSPRQAESHDIMIPEAHVVSSDTVTDKDVPRQTKNGGAGVKSSTQAGLRRRRSIDQGLGQNNVVLEKY